MLTTPLSNHRTTLTLDADAFEFARTYADAKAMKLSQAVSDLIRQARGKTEAKLVKKGHAWVLVAPPTGKKITSEQVKDLLEQD